MRKIFPDLWQTRTEHPIPGMPDVISNAYLLLRENGNVLFYNTDREAIGTRSDDDDLDRIEELGGISYQFLGHWHEVSPSLKRIRDRFDSKHWVHRGDASAVERRGGAAPDRLFDARETVLDDIEVIPTPGHTAGSVSFGYRSPHGRTYLFTGDAIIPTRQAWAAVPLKESDSTQIRESLALLRSLEPDVVIAAAANAPQTFGEVTGDTWREAVDHALWALERKAA